jgi:hypothetical protein
MVELNEHEAVLILRIMNTAAWTYPEHVRRQKGGVMDDIERLRDRLEGYVGTVHSEID